MTTKTLEEINARVADCRQCTLGETRQLTVFGEGHPRAKLILVGEAPGRKEDESGRPFVGAAGKVLDELLAEAGLKREETFITSVVKCRPPKNRLPKKPEVAACVTYLQEQIEAIKPKVILCMGSLATNTLLDSKAKISQVRGQWFERDGIKIMPTFHPASAIYERSRLGAIKEDFAKLGKELKE